MNDFNNTSKVMLYFFKEQKQSLAVENLHLWCVKNLKCANKNLRVLKIYCCERFLFMVRFLQIKYEAQEILKVISVLWNSAVLSL